MDRDDIERLVAYVLVKSGHSPLKESERAYLEKSGDASDVLYSILSDRYNVGDGSKNSQRNIAKREYIRDMIRTSIALAEAK